MSGRSSYPRVVDLRDALQVERVKAGHYKASIHPDVCFRTVASGGHLITQIQLALELAFEHDYQTSKQPHLMSLHSSMLRPSVAGEAEIRIKEAKLGPIASTVQFSLLQKSKVNITGFATHINFDNIHPSLYTFPYKNSSILNPAPPPAPNLTQLESNTDPNWLHYIFNPENDLPMRIITNLNWYFPRPVPLSSPTTPRPPASSAIPTQVEYWLSPVSPTSRFHTFDLGFISDIGPRLVESIRPGHDSSRYTVQSFIDRGLKQEQNLSHQITPMQLPPTAYPTLNLSLEVKRPLPREGVRWVYVRATLQWFADGKWDMEVVMCDESMEVVALARLLNLSIDLNKASNAAGRQGVGDAHKQKMTKL